MAFTYTRTETRESGNSKEANRFFEDLHNNLDVFYRMTRHGATVATWEKHPSASLYDFRSGIVTGPNFQIEKIDRYGDNPMLYYRSEDVTIYASNSYHCPPAYLSTVKIGDISLNGINAVANAEVLKTMNGIMEYLQSPELIKSEKTDSEPKQKTPLNG